MFKKILKPIAYTIYVVLLVSLLVEVSSQMYVRIFRDDLVSQKQKEDTFRLDMVKDWDAQFKASPYFGYVKANGNNYGFESHENYPLVKNEKTYVIGILGGSVANNFGIYIDMEDTYKDRLKSSIPFLKNKEIKFMSLAVPGYKQPQQFITLSYFIDQVDLVIQLDGWNEAWVRTSHQFPADYPAFSEFFYSKQISSKVAQLAAEKSLIDGINNNKILKHSMTFLLIQNILKNRVNDISETLLVNHEDFFYKQPMSDQDLKSISVMAMVKYLKMEHDLLRMYNKKAFFFIQPSQYNADSKPFSEQELKIAFSTAREAPINALAFQAVRREAVKLGSVDLAGVFRKVNETVYKDDCCHLNNKGNQIMADEIFSYVIKNLK